MRAEPLASTPTARQIALQECLYQTAGQGWTPPETAAWTSICNHQPVRFQQGQAPNTLRAAFMQAIFTDPGLTKYSSTGNISFINADFPALDLAGGSVEQVTLDHCHVHGDVTLSDMHVAHRLTLTADVIDGAVTLDDVSAGAVLITTMQAKQLTVSQSQIDSWRAAGMQLNGPLLMTNVAASEGIVLSNATAPLIYLFQVKDQFLSLSGDRASRVVIIGVSTTDTMSLRNLAWPDEKAGELELIDISAARLDWSNSEPNAYGSGPPDVPAAVPLRDVSAGSIYLGNDPASVMRAVARAADAAAPDAAFYTAAARTYAERGRADQSRSLLYLEDNALYRADHFWPWPLPKMATFVMWMFFGYGLYPEVGLIWIALIVIAAAYLFRRGAGALAAGNPPSNWLLFTVDAVLPGINLDPEHHDIRFHGWRQILLYGVRLLGGVVVFIFLRLLQQSASADGSG